MQWREKNRQAEERVLEGIPHAKVVYENDLLKSECHQDTMDRLFKFIGVSTVQVGTDMIRINTKQLSETIENYDAIAEGITAAGFGHWLD